MKAKRFLATLLTLTMIISLLSAYTLTASAEETTTTVEAVWGVSENDLTAGSGTLAEAIAAASAENSTVKYIKLAKDIEATTNYAVKAGEFTLDLNGCKLDFYGQKNQPTLWIRYAGTKITLVDSTNSDGRVTQDCDSTVTTDAIYVSDGAEVIINSGNYKGISAASVKANSKLTINGGKFETKTACPVYCSGGTLVINGGTFIGGTNSAVHLGSGEIVINGGNFTSGTNGVFSYFRGKLTISEFENSSGNTMYVSNHNAPLTITSDMFVLPTGYAICSGDTVVTELEYKSTYTIKEMPICNITVENSENGTVTADVTTARYGEEITLTATPADGYKLMSITVTDEKGNPVAVMDNKFIMPERAVTITAVFELEAEVFYVVLNPVKGTCDVETISVAADGTLSEELPIPTPNDKITEGYVFKGWYDTPTGGNKITADTVFVINTTIYAQWDVIKPEIVKYNTQKVDFTFPKAGENIIVIFADYKSWDDPTFVGIKYVPVTTTKTEGENVISVSVPNGIELWAGDKIMIWKDFTTLTPLCKAYEVTGREVIAEDTNPGIDLPIDRN